MRKALADIRPRVVNRAVVAVQKDASVLGAAQDDALLRFFGGGWRKKSMRANPQIAPQQLHVASGKLDRTDTAAVGALRAIDLLCDLFRDAAEDPVGVVVRLHVATKTQ